MATDKSNHLQCVLESHKMSKVEDLMNKYISKRNEVKETLEGKYSDKLATNPINSGSYAKHTAMNKKFDIDLCAPFTRVSFNTLEEMADELFRYFDQEYKDDQLKRPIRKQRVSIGLDFIIDGEEISMDVVPGREINKDEYTETYDLKLYVRAKGLDPATETKTNIKKHIDEISGRNSEREIIRLLKVWKYYNGKDIKSFMIELLVLRTFDDNKGSIPDGLWEKLEMTMKFIRDKVESIELKDPANSNNIVSSTMQAYQKSALAADMRNMLDNIARDSEYIKSYFKVNPDFPCKEENKYAQKASGATVLKTQSFGLSGYG